MPEKKQVDTAELFQLIWGIALLIMGIAFLFRIPEVMNNISGIEHFGPAVTLIRICLYFVAVILIGGGCKKLYTHYSRQRSSEK